MTRLPGVDDRTLLLEFSLAVCLSVRYQTKIPPNPAAAVPATSTSLNLMEDLIALYQCYAHVYSENLTSAACGK